MPESKTNSMSKRHLGHNSTFYEEGAAYFKALYTKGKTDFEFEDEYYFTMPALSGREDKDR